MHRQREEASENDSLLPLSEAPTGKSGPWITGQCAVPPLILVSCRNLNLYSFLALAYRIACVLLLKKSSCHGNSTVWTHFPETGHLIFGKNRQMAFRAHTLLLLLTKCLIAMPPSEISKPLSEPSPYISFFRHGPYLFGFIKNMLLQLNQECILFIIHFVFVC